MSSDIRSDVFQHCKPDIALCARMLLCTCPAIFVPMYFSIASQTSPCVHVCCSAHVQRYSFRCISALQARHRLVCTYVALHMSSDIRSDVFQHCKPDIALCARMLLCTCPAIFVPMYFSIASQTSPC